MTTPHRLKIPLKDQIATIRGLRDAWEGLAVEGARFPDGPDPQERADVLNGVLMTLELLAAHETEFRAFMAERSKGMGR